MANSFSVIFRTGGTDNFKWNRVGDIFTRETAAVKAAELERMGYRALVHTTSLLNSVGMPEGFDA